MRKHWIDNLRWFTVVMVLLYHVIYMFNNKEVLGGLGGFVEDPTKQPQDIIMYILYPWFMMILFLLAGISARYSLEKRTVKEFVNSRALKLVVPTTVGLFVYQWITGYINILNSPAADFSQIPLVFRWMIYASVGTGPLWFAQELLAFSILLLLIRKLDPNDKFRNICSKASVPVIILMGILVYLGSQVMIYNPDPLKPSEALVNLYRPLAYFIPFLMGYFVFSNESVQEKVKGMCIPMSICAAVTCIAICITGWGKSMTSPEFLSGWLNCLYAWLMILAMMGLFMRFFDKTDKFCSYMTRINFGLYVLHYSIIVSLGYVLKNMTTLPVALIYIILIIAVFTLTPALYEIFHRIPFIRWAVLGERKKK